MSKTTFCFTSDTLFAEYPARMKLPDWMTGKGYSHYVLNSADDKIYIPDEWLPTMPFDYINVEHEEDSNIASSITICYHSVNPESYEHH